MLTFTRSSIRTSGPEIFPPQVYDYDSLTNLAMGLLSGSTPEVHSSTLNIEEVRSQITLMLLDNANVSLG